MHQDISRCYESVKNHLKDAGYSKITSKKASDIRKKYVDYIFEIQEKTFLHIESNSNLPYCWESPHGIGT